MVIHVSEMQKLGPNTSSRLRGAKNGCKYNARHGTNENKQTAHLFVDVRKLARRFYIYIYISCSRDSANREILCSICSHPYRTPTTLVHNLASKMAAQISKKRKFVADGVFRAELNEFFTRELAEEGYSGCDVRVTHARTEVLH